MRVWREGSSGYRHYIVLRVTTKGTGMIPSRCIEILWLDHLATVVMAVAAAALGFEPCKRKLHSLKMKSVSLCTTELLR